MKLNARQGRMFAGDDTVLVDSSIVVVIPLFALVFCFALLTKNKNCIDAKLLKLL